MTPQEQVNHFQTFGFLHCKQLLSPDEIQVISDSFDVAMRTARGGTPEPTPGNEAAALAANLELSSPNRANQEQADVASPVVRQDVIPLFDYDPDVFYPLLDDDRIFDISERLLGEHFILAATAGTIHMGGIGWHHDIAQHGAVAPEGYFTMRAAIYLDPLRPEDGCLNVIPGGHSRNFGRRLAKT